jgi:uncharacterized membrane protein
MKAVPGTTKESLLSPKKQWLLPTGLIVLSAIPVGAGAFRLVRLAVGEAVTADNARFLAAPLPVVVHIIGASLFCVLGAFQFLPSLRQGRRGWHRIAGRLLVPCGLAAALSGLWMSVFYELPASDDQSVELFQLSFGILQLVRLFVGTGMVVSLLLGVAAIRTRSFTSHRAWMMRAYALGMGAGTQALLNVPWLLLWGNPEGSVRVLLMVLGWAINLAIVEWSIRARRPGRASGAQPIVHRIDLRRPAQ